MYNEHVVPIAVQIMREAFLLEKDSIPKGAVCRYLSNPRDCIYRDNQTAPFGFFV